jgi:putative transposase
MGKPYSQELREAIIKAVAGGCTLELAAKDYEVSLSTVTRLLRRSRVTGNVKPDKFGGHKPYALTGHEEQIKRWIREQPDITLKQLRTRLLKQGIAVGKSSIARFRDHLFPEEAAARRAWREELSRLMLDLNVSRSGQFIGNDDSVPQGSEEWST